MNKSSIRRHNAENTQQYIEDLKQEVGSLLYSKTRLIYSGLHIPTPDFEHAVTCIHEVIDDMLRNYIKEAQQIISCNNP